MKRRVMPLVAALLLFALRVQPQAAEFTIDPNHSSVGFRVRHMVSQVKGQFTDFAGTFRYDPKSPEKSAVDAVIQTKSVNTNVDKRDAHLRSPDFFDAEKFPSMTFKSTGVTISGPGKFAVAGTLTIRGISKPVVLAVEGGDTAKDPWGGTRAGFSASTTVNRKDFGMVWNKALDNGGLLVGDEVTIAIDVEGVEKK